MKVKEGIVVVFLILNAWRDIRVRQIWLWSVLLFGMVGILYGLIAGEGAFLAVMAAIAPGLLFLGIAKVTDQSMGYGDGLIILVMGIYSGINRVVTSMLIALILAALWAGVLLSICKKGGKAQFPFVPFLLIGYLGGMGL